MRFVKFFFIGVIALLVVLTAFSFIFPSHLRVGRDINIAASREKVQATISDLRSWDHWNDFIRSTPLTGQSFSSPASGKGAFLSYDQLLVSESVAQPDRIEFIWKQPTGKNFEGGYNLLQLRPDSLTVQWWFDFHFRYPWEKLAVLVYDKKFGTVMEESLVDLKHYIENSP